MYYGSIDEEMGGGSGSGGGFNALMKKKKKKREMEKKKKKGQKEQVSQQPRQQQSGIRIKRRAVAGITRDEMFSRLSSAIIRNAVAGICALIVTNVFFIFTVYATYFHGGHSLWKNGFIFSGNAMKYYLTYIAMTFTYRDWRVMLYPLCCFLCGDGSGGSGSGDQCYCVGCGCCERAERKRRRKLRAMAAKQRGGREREQKCSYCCFGCCC